MTNEIRIESTEEMNRIICNNQRFGIEAYCLWKKNLLRLATPHAVVQWLAWRGERLAERIIESFENTDFHGTKGLPGCACNCILYSSDVAVKLISRRMTGQEYKDYLEGKKAIGTNNGRSYFLTKQNPAMAA